MRVKQKLDGYEGGDIRSVQGQVRVMSLPHIGFELQHIIHLLEHPLAWKHTSFRTSNVARNYIIIALFSLSKSCLQYSKTNANCYIGSIMFES